MAGVPAGTKADSKGSEEWHDLTVRVYYEDTDAQGIVYFANYLRFMERGRTEWLRARGVDQAALSRDRQLCFSLINTSVQFLRPAKFDDQLVVRTRVIHRTGARVSFEQAVHRDTAAGELLCAAECEAACLHTGTLKPTRVPADLFAAPG